MKNFKIHAEPMIAWIRLCRPGSIYGPRKDYLKSCENQYHQMETIYVASIPEVKDQDQFYVF